MIAFIDEHRDRFGVKAICRTLGATACGFITSRAYRAAQTRPAGLQAVRRGRKPITTRPAGEPDARPDLLKRPVRR
ncbi:hypothetical protein [Micrococcus porci]|uniref:hypothetical protein n=1 Tax=Micrococcus porci TaxID=2856555 RepID=UPI003CED07CA